MKILRKTICKRKQLFEFQDFSWCPQAVREGITDLLVLNLKIIPLYEPTINWLSKMAKISNGEWVDLCAGAGGGSILLKEKMPGEIKNLYLTDLYPHKNLQNLQEGVKAIDYSVDAANVPHELKGFRTLFTSFHHLRDEVAFDVLKNAKESKTPIGIFEFTGRNLYTLLAVLPSFITSFLLVPFVIPWKFSRFFWTYFIPLIPLFTLSDIVLSCFRTRDIGELNNLVMPLKGERYNWEIGELPTYAGLKITYLVGFPS